MSYAGRYCEVLPVRPKLIGLMSRLERRSWLVQQYLESRVGCADQTESIACRRFLKAWNARNRSLGIQLDIGPALSPRAVEISAYIPGKGRVATMPTLVTESNPKLALIARETSAGRETQVLPDATAKPSTDVYGEPTRKGFPPKEPTVLYPGKP